MPATILIFLFGDLGDAILTIPAIRALRRKYPATRLLLFAKRGPGEVVLSTKLVDELVVVDKHAFDSAIALLNPRAIMSVLRLALRLRRSQPDVVVIFHHLVTRWGTLKFALLSLTSGARRRVGLDNGRGWFLTDRVKDEGFGAHHEVSYWLAVSALLGACGDAELQSPDSANDERAADGLLALRATDTLIAVHPGTGWYGPGRQWAPEKFASAATIILHSRPATFVVVGTNEDGAAARRVLNSMPTGTIDLVGKTTAGELAAVLRRCDLLLANDGGVGHLAAAVGTPVISVFGPSNDRAWGPLTATVVAADLPCRPCFYRDFERGLPGGCATRECLALVTPEAVATAALRRLGTGSGES